MCIRDRLRMTASGFADDIDLLVGVLNDGTVYSISVLDAHETFGLGQKAKNDWDFLGSLLGGTGDTSIADVDSITGATITSSAVLSAVNNAAKFMADSGVGADGALTGESSGFGGPITVEVTMDGDDITSVTIVSNSETPSIAGDALEQIPAAIVEADTADAVSYTHLDGLAQANVDIYAVTINSEGVIVDCKIDAIQCKTNFNASGAITTDLTGEIRSKMELDDEYAMRGASSISAEWDEQVRALEEYCIGKTPDEVAGIAVDESGVATDADLVAGITMPLANFIDGVVNACNNARVNGAKEGDTDVYKRQARY